MTYTLHCPILPAPAGRATIPVGRHTRRLFGIHSEGEALCSLTNIFSDA